MLDIILVNWFDLLIHFMCKILNFGFNFHLGKWLYGNLISYTDSNFFSFIDLPYDFEFNLSI